MSVNDSRDGTQFADGWGIPYEEWAALRPQPLDLQDAAAVAARLVAVEKRIAQIVKDLGRLREQVDQVQHQGGI